MTKKDNTTPEIENKAKHTKLLSRLSVAKANEKKDRDRWKVILKVLDGQRDVEINGETSSLKVKYPLLWAAYDNYISELTSTPPQTVIDATDKEDLVKKIYWKGILENVKRKIRLDDLRDEAFESFVLTGKLVYKVGRAVETEVTEKTAETTLEGKKKTVKAEFEKITKNETFVTTVDPRKVWLSPETHYTGPVLKEECPYIVEEMVKTPEYVKDRYGVELEETELEIISTNEDTDDATKTNVPNEQKDDLKRVRLYAYYGTWEYEGQLHANCEVLFTSKKIIKERVLPYAHKKKPYIYVCAFKKFFETNSRGTLDTVVDLDREYNEHHNRMRTILRRMATPKYAKLKGQQVDEAALLDPDVGTVVEESQANSFRVIETGKIDNGLFDKATSVEQLFYLLTGINYGASALNKSATATGQREQAQGSDVKIGRLVRKLERGQEELETMILQLEQQYAPSTGTDIRIIGGDVVKLIQDKKKLFKAKYELWEKDQQNLAVNAQNQGVDPNQIQPETPPVDEYEQFQISEDGRAVFTSYTRDEIQGEFELRIITQSSNRSDRLIRAKLYMDAITASAADPTVNRTELWKRWFLLQGEDDVEGLINEQVQQPLQQPMPTPQTSGGGATANEGAMVNQINTQATQI